jgi:hypothetical protein
MFALGDLDAQSLPAPGHPDRCPRYPPVVADHGQRALAAAPNVAPEGGTTLLNSRLSVWVALAMAIGWLWRRLTAVRPRTAVAWQTVLILAYPAWDAATGGLTSRGRPSSKAWRTDRR